MTSIADGADEDGEGAGEKRSPGSGTKRKQPKVPFYLNSGDAEAFRYGDAYLITEIKDELNRICSVENAKHVFGTDVFRYLMSLGYVEERKTDGRIYQSPTELGTARGIGTVERTGKSGMVYTVLTYPPEVQKEIVEHYSAAREE